MTDKGRWIGYADLSFQLSREGRRSGGKRTVSYKMNFFVCSPSTLPSGLTAWDGYGGQCRRRGEFALDIRGFRAELSEAFQADGFVEKRLFKGVNKVWVHQQSGEITSYFAPDAQRRPWGFRLFGVIGIDVPLLRTWLNQYRTGSESGIFQAGFVGYYTANDDLLNDFQIEHDVPVPADLWVGLIKDRLDRIPSSLDALLETYRTNREELGWLAHPHQKAAWDFLVKWHKNPDPTLSVPHQLPNGQIV